MEDWININKSNRYFRTCNKCNQEIVIEQHGDELSEYILEAIINEVHINKYDALLKYIPVHDKLIKIDVEVLQNSCQKT